MESTPAYIQSIQSFSDLPEQVYPPPQAAQLFSLPSPSVVYNLVPSPFFSFDLGVLPGPSPTFCLPQLGMGDLEMRNPHQKIANSGEIMSPPAF